MGRVYTRSRAVAPGKTYRRKTQWGATGTANDLGPVAVAAGVVQFRSQSATLLEPVTAVRVHGIVNVAPTATSAARDIWGAAGLIIVKEQAAGVGVSALPDPLIGETSVLLITTGSGNSLDVNVMTRELFKLY